MVQAHRTDMIRAEEVRYHQRAEGERHTHGYPHFFVVQFIPIVNCSNLTKPVELFIRFNAPDNASPFLCHSLCRTQAFTHELKSLFFSRLLVHYQPGALSGILVHSSTVHKCTLSALPLHSSVSSWCTLS